MAISFVFALETSFLPDSSMHSSYIKNRAGKLFKIPSSIDSSYALPSEVHNLYSTSSPSYSSYIPSCQKTVSYMPLPCCRN